MKYKKQKTDSIYSFGGVLKDAGKILLNSAATPFETISGVDFYKPEFENNTMSKLNDVNTNISKIGTNIGATALLGPMGPAALQATSSIGQSLTSDGAPQLLANGGQLTHFQNGGSHEQNPNGGIPIGKILVEEGETMNKDFVFSDRLTVNKILAKEFNLPNKAIGKTFAEVSKMFEDESRPNDQISKKGFDKEVANLKQAQEAFKQIEGIDQPQSNQMAYGGPTGSLINDQFNFMSTNPSTLDLFNVPYTEPVNQQQIITEFDKQPIANTINNQNVPVSTPVNQNTTVSQNPITEMSFEDELAMSNSLDNQQIDNLNLSKTSSSQGITNNLIDSEISGVGNLNNKTNFSIEDYSSLLRFAPIASEAINLGRTLSNKSSAKNTSMFNTNQVFNPNLVNAEQINRDIESQGNATRNVIRNNTGGNQASLMSNLLASQLQTDQAIGQSNIQVDSINNQELARIEGLNYNQAQTNASKQMQIQDWNDRDIAAWNNALMQSTSTMGQNIGNVGTDSMNRNMAKDLPIQYFMDLLGKTNYKGAQ